MKSSIGLISLGAVLVVGLFFLSALVFMLLGNVVLNHFHVQTLDYTAAMASVLLLSIFIGAGNANSKN